MARKKIEESQARQKLAIEAAELGTFELNLVTDELIHNERMPLIFGFETGAVQNMTTAFIRDSIHPDDQHIRSKAMEEAWETSLLVRGKGGIAGWHNPLDQDQSQSFF